MIGAKYTTSACPKCAEVVGGAVAEAFGRPSSPAAPITRVMPTVIAGGETMCIPSTGDLSPLGMHAPRQPQYIQTSNVPLNFLALSW